MLHERRRNIPIAWVRSRTAKVKATKPGSTLSPNDLFEDITARSRKTLLGRVSDTSWVRKIDGPVRLTIADCGRTVLSILLLGARGIPEGGELCQDGSADPGAVHPLGGNSDLDPAWTMCQNN